jgi:DNA invertase Pin-like site-specific DNA recombinase
MIRERVKAGIARAKAQGKHCGRPSIKAELAQAIRDALAVPAAQAFALSPSSSACRR